MSFREKIESMTTDLLEDIIKENNVELVDVEYVKEAGNWYLRIFIDKENGVTIDDCEIVSRAFDAKFEEVDPIADPYILEVSSPGLDRPLKKDNDFVRSMGKTVEVKLYKALDGEKEFVGELKKYEDKKVTIAVEDQEMIFDMKDIAIIRLAVIF